MEYEIHLWHYGVILAGFAVVGMLGHIVRAVFNLYPDRLTDNPRFDAIFSNDYSFKDYIFQLEFDENGYYELYSWKNLRFYFVAGMLGGLATMIFVPHLDQDLAFMIDAALESLNQLFWYRLQHIRWY